MIVQNGLLGKENIQKFLDLTVDKFKKQHVQIHSSVQNVLHFLTLLDQACKVEQIE